MSSCCVGVEGVGDNAELDGGDGEACTEGFAELPGVEESAIFGRDFEEMGGDPERSLGELSILSVEVHVYLVHGVEDWLEFFLGRVVVSEVAHLDRQLLCGSFPRLCAIGLGEQPGADALAFVAFVELVGRLPRCGRLLWHHAVGDGAKLGGIPVAISEAVAGFRIAGFDQRCRHAGLVVGVAHRLPQRLVVGGVSHNHSKK